MWGLRLGDQGQGRAVGNPGVAEGTRCGGLDLMWVRIHDDEADTTEAAARALLREQIPGWAELPMSYVNSSGTDNAMWRLHQPNDNDCRRP